MGWILKSLKTLFFNLLIAKNWLRKIERFKVEGGHSTAGFIVGEFFHEDLGRFGGYGKTVKNIAQHYNLKTASCSVKVIISKRMPAISKPEIRRFNDADVLLCPLVRAGYVESFREYSLKMGNINPGLLMSIDYYSSYEYPLLAAPRVPLIVWIRDPRSKVELEELATIPLELKARSEGNRDKYVAQAKYHEKSLKNVLQLSRVLKRKIIFASNGHFLIERARRTYGLPELEPFQLPNPIPQPAITQFTYSNKPSFYCLGRLDAQKRFWIFCELAKRFPNADFYLGGITEFPDLVNPILDKYRDVSNLKFLGVVDGENKEKLLANCWALINTSIHEGFPVTFQEAFSYGKCVISSLDPDGVVQKYGYYTGPILGEGLDQRSLDAFSKRIEEFLGDKKGREEKGRQARLYVERQHSFSNFEKHLRRILKEIYDRH